MKSFQLMKKLILIIFLIKNIYHQKNGTNLYLKKILNLLMPENLLNIRLVHLKMRLIQKLKILETLKIIYQNLIKINQ